MVSGPFNEDQIIEGEKQSSWGNASQMSLHCFEKQDFNRFSQEQKSRVKKLFDGKRIWMTREKPNFTLSKNHKYTYL